MPTDTYFLRLGLNSYMCLQMSFFKYIFLGKLSNVKYCFRVQFEIIFMLPRKIDLSKLYWVRPSALDEQTSSKNLLVEVKVRIQNGGRKVASVPDDCGCATTSRRTEEKFIEKID